MCSISYSFNSFLLVFVSELGDKTQLLALVLAVRFRKPWAIMAGILVASALNHGLASWAGGWLAASVDPRWLRWGLAGAFFGFAVWVLRASEVEEYKPSRYGAFITTLIAFFLGEMGDKTQLAVVALGAQSGSPLQVTVGSVCAMIVANGIPVFLGDRLTRVLPMKLIRRVAAALFVVFGLYILM